MPEELFMKFRFLPRNLLRRVCATTAFSISSSFPFLPADSARDARLRELICIYSLSAAPLLVDVFYLLFAVRSRRSRAARYSLKFTSSSLTWGGNFVPPSCEDESQDLRLVDQINRYY